MYQNFVIVFVCPCSRFDFSMGGALTEYAHTAKSDIMMVWLHTVHSAPLRAPPTGPQLLPLPLHIARLSCMALSVLRTSKRPTPLTLIGLARLLVVAVGIMCAWAPMLRWAEWAHVLDDFPTTWISTNSGRVVVVVVVVALWKTIAPEKKRTAMG